MICQRNYTRNLVNKIVLHSLERTRKLCHDDQADENCKWLQNETPASLELAGNVKTFGVCVWGGGGGGGTSIIKYHIRETGKKVFHGVNAYL